MTTTVVVRNSRTRKWLRRAFENVERASSLVALWAYKQQNAIESLDDEHEARLLANSRRHVHAIIIAYRKAAKDRRITPEENERIEEHHRRAMRGLAALATYDAHENAQHAAAMIAADATRQRCRALNYAAADAITDLDYRQGGVEHPIRTPSISQLSIADFAAQGQLPLEAE